MKSAQGILALIVAMLTFMILGRTTENWAYAQNNGSIPIPPAANGNINIHSMSTNRKPVGVREIEESVITGALLYNGGPVQTAPKVYVVYWGWTSDPYGEQVYLQDFLSTVGGTAWLNTVTQYSSAGNPSALYGGAWSDPTPVPTAPTDAQIQAEAVSAIHHFGLGTSVNFQVVVATPTGHSTAGFGTTFCAYHGAVAAYPNVTYTDLPYIHDAGSACGANSVSGPLDGVSIVEGHELAESITDPLLNAWKDAGGNEVGDKCAWTNLADIATSLGTFAVQPLWSNAANGCVLSSGGGSSVPAPPSTVRIDASSDCPFMNITWSAVPGVTYYVVNLEANYLPWIPGFAAQYTVSAPSTSKLVKENLGDKPYLAKVSSCNANGCSALSAATGTAYTPSLCP